MDDIEDVDLAELMPFIDRELAERSSVFLTGIEKYRSHPFSRSGEEPPCIWAEGTTRLLDFGPATGKPVLVIPSLVNRSYILDLLPGHSLLGFLSDRGLRPLLIDWGKPGPTEREFGLADYIGGRLEAALTAITDLTGMLPSLLGYCMGGLLALALATRRPADLRHLVLLATPWDFHAVPAVERHAMQSLSAFLPSLFHHWGEIPTDALQAVFAMHDPLLASRKFSHFARLDPASEEARRFVAIEDWLNDGVPLPLPAARDCLGGWYAQNLPMKGGWRVGDRIVDVTSLKHSSLIVIPATDRLVPPATAYPLGTRLKNRVILDVPLGHVGIVTGKSAPKLVWEQIVNHLEQ